MPSTPNTPKANSHNKRSRRSILGLFVGSPVVLFAACAGLDTNAPKKTADDPSGTDDKELTKSVNPRDKIRISNKNLLIVKKGIQKNLINIIEKYKGLRWVGKLHGNGNRDVAIYIPPETNPNKPYEIIYHFHGTNGQNLSKGSVGENRITQSFDSAERLAKTGKRNIIVVYPLSLGARGRPGGYAHRNGYDDYWMSTEKSNDNMQQLHQEVLQTITQEFEFDIQNGSITIEGHSAGGRALQNICESGFRVDKIIFLDANYGDWVEKCYKAAQLLNPNVKMRLIVKRGKGTHDRAMRFFKKYKKGVKIITTHINHGNMNTAFFGYSE